MSSGLLQSNDKSGEATSEISGAKSTSSLSVEDVKGLIQEATSQVQRSVELNEKRIEAIDRRSRQKLVRLVHLDAKIVPNKCDWLTKLREVTVEMGVCKDSEEASTHVLGLDLELSNPSSGSFVLEVSSMVRPRCLTPTKSIREAISAYNVKLGRSEKSKNMIRFHSVLTVCEDRKKERAKFFLSAYIEFNKIEKKEIIIKLPNAKYDRVIVECKKGSVPRKYLTFSEVSAIIGSTEEEMDIKYAAHLVEKEEKRKVRQEANRKRKLMEDESSGTLAKKSA